MTIEEWQYQWMRTDEWRYPNERRELVERLIRVEAENVALFRLMRDLTSDDTPASLLLAKEKQLLAAERNIEILSKKVKAA